MDRISSLLQRNINELLIEFPALGDILNAYNIGCVTCSVGTCQLQDIVKYHYLPEDQLQELMRRMAVMVEQSMPENIPAAAQ